MPQKYFFIILQFIQYQRKKFQYNLKKYLFNIRL